MRRNRTEVQQMHYTLPGGGRELMHTCTLCMYIKCHINMQEARSALHGVQLFLLQRLLTYIMLGRLPGEQILYTNILFPPDI